MHAFLARVFCNDKKNGKAIIKEESQNIPFQREGLSGRDICDIQTDPHSFRCAVLYCVSLGHCFYSALPRDIEGERKEQEEQILPLLCFLSSNRSGLTGAF